MHPNPMYRNDDHDHTLEYARERAFGVLTINGSDGPLAAHIPFIIAEDETYLEAHVMRSNPIWRAIETPTPALLTISGADSYISPDWYGVDDQVPTWNYVAVNLRGTLSRLPVEDLRGVLDRLSHQFESRLLPKPIWKADKMTPEILERFMRMIVPIRMEIEVTDSTWKLGQNKTETARKRAADGLEAAKIGQDTHHIATLMRNIKDPT